jgi:hypothetical protein
VIAWWWVPVAAALAGFLAWLVRDLIATRPRFLEPADVDLTRAAARGELDWAGEFPRPPATTIEPDGWPHRWSVRV